MAIFAVPSPQQESKTVLKIQYFASVREAMARAEETIEPPETVRTVADLVSYLASEDAKFAEISSAGNPLLVAINHSVVDRDAELSANDEVAFFPPMTGG